MAAANKPCYQHGATVVDVGASSRLQQLTTGLRCSPALTEECNRLSEVTAAVSVHLLSRHVATAAAVQKVNPVAAAGGALPGTVGGNTTTAICW